MCTGCAAIVPPAVLGTNQPGSRQGSSGPDETARNQVGLTQPHTLTQALGNHHGIMLPWLRHNALDHLARAMAPPTAGPGGPRQTTLNSSWGFNATGLWQSGRRTASPAPRAAPAPPLVYQITDTTQLLLLRGDITLFGGDAIVNAGACLPQPDALDSTLSIYQDTRHSMVQFAAIQVQML